MNIKRAFKTMSKAGDGYILAEELPINHNWLICNGHLIITVSNDDFQKNKQFIKNLREVDDERLSKVILKEYNKEVETIRTTSVLIENGYRGAFMRVMESKHHFACVNDTYLGVFEDVENNTPLYVAIDGDEKVKTPIFNCKVANGIVYEIQCILPINCNVRDVLTDVLNH